MGGISIDGDGEDAQHAGCMATALGVGNALRALGTVVHEERSNEISSVGPLPNHLRVAGEARCVGLARLRCATVEASCAAPLSASGWPFWDRGSAMCGLTTTPSSGDASGFGAARCQPQAVMPMHATIARPTWRRGLGGRVSRSSTRPSIARRPRHSSGRCPKSADLLLCTAMTFWLTEPGKIFVSLPRKLSALCR